jgi:hypothetical protein
LHALRNGLELQTSDATVIRGVDRSVEYRRQGAYAEQAQGDYDDEEESDCSPNPYASAHPQPSLARRAARTRLS